MAIDKRVVRVSIGVDNRLRVFEGLAIIAQGAKYASAVQNEADIKIANLSRGDRDLIATETSPFSKRENKPRSYVILEAGRESTGVSKIFEGDISSSSVSQPPDIWTSLKVKTSQSQKGNIISTNEPAVSSLSAIAAKAAEVMGLSLDFLADDKQISNYGFTGSAAQQVEKIASLGSVDAFVDDSKMVIKNMNAPNSAGVRVISQQTGMIGVPVITDFGVNVRFLIDTKVNVGDAVEIDSKFYPAANGQYVIYKLNFIITNREIPFYYIAETRRPGVIGNG